MEMGDKFLNFHLPVIRYNLDKKDHINIRQFTKFEVLSLDFNHEEGFKKSEKLETIAWICKAVDKRLEQCFLKEFKATCKKNSGESELKQHKAI